VRQIQALDMSSNVTKFWRSYVYVGVLTYTMGAFAVLVYALTEPVPHRTALVVLGALSLVASIGAFRLIGLRLVETRWSKTFFTSWAALTFVFIAVGAVLDGGVRSPISYFLILPMLFAGLAYSAGTVTFLAGFGVVTSLVVGLLTPDRSWSTTVFLAVGMVIAGVITAAAAANRDRLMRQLMAAANLDALTGCLSRGAFQERLVHESMLAQRHDAVFSLIVADVDNLKTINDSSGHHCGDRALRLLASVLRQAARETDVVGRLGGDEFAMLLHETNEEAAMSTASRLRGALHDVTGSDWVTASIGISTWLGPHDNPEALFRRADGALYVAKRSGRNRVAMWEPPVAEAQGGLQWLSRRPRHTVVRRVTPAEAVGRAASPAVRPAAGAGVDDELERWR
jgi:diguanylate cyclase (GGDEF)-like protein